MVLPSKGTQQWSKIKELKISPSIKCHLILVEDTKNIHWKKTNLFDK
jgi:hypothetical protein